MAPEHRPDRPLRNRRARRGAGGLSGRTGGRQRPRRSDRRRRTRAPGRVMAGDRTSVPLPLGGRRRRDRPRLRGPGSARQQPTPAHGRIPTADEQRHRRLHALLLPRLRRRSDRHHGGVLRRWLGLTQPPRCRLRPLRTRDLGRRPAHESATHATTCSCDCLVLSREACEPPPSPARCFIGRHHRSACLRVAAAPSLPSRGAAVRSTTSLGSSCGTALPTGATVVRAPRRGPDAACSSQ